jgi:hypothetical protein
MNSSNDFPGSKSRVDKMKRFDLYGSSMTSLEEIRSEFEFRVGGLFAAHESGYVGGGYLRASAPGDEILILAHVADEEGYLAEPGFEDWAFLVYVNESQRWPELEVCLSRVKDLVLLRTEEL